MVCEMKSVLFFNLKKQKSKIVKRGVTVPHLTCPLLPAANGGFSIVS